MGIMTRQFGEEFVITSDCDPLQAPTKLAAKKVSGVYHVWTGNAWSPVVAEAKAFDTLDKADEYIKENYAQVTGLC